MTKSMLAIAATVALATAGSAQMAAHSTTTATAPRATGAATMTRTTATHTTKSGKTITYDCSKKGNANKKACKK